MVSPPAPAVPVLRQVGILVFEEVEVLDFAGPFEVFSVAGRILDHTTMQGGPGGLIQAHTIAQTAQVIHTRGGLAVQPSCTFEQHPPLDVLVVPGGWGTRREVDNFALLAWLRRTTATTPLVASVCTGAFLLGQIGLLDGRPSTTHWASLDRLAATFPETQVVRGVRWVDTGPVLSSSGISAGIDLSLHLVARLCGVAIAEQTARQMEYRWERQP